MTKKKEEIFTRRRESDVDDVDSRCVPFSTPSHLCINPWMLSLSPSRHQLGLI